MTFETKDSGKREEMATGSVRDSREGKGRFELVSPFALARVAGVYERGAKKYDARNWEKGQPFSRFLDSAMRHLNRFAMGWTDEDHLAQACWNILAIMHFQEIGRKDLDDMPHYQSGPHDDIVRQLYPANPAANKADCEAFAQAMTQPGQPTIRPGKWVQRDGTVVDIEPGICGGDYVNPRTGIGYNQHSWHAGAYRTCATFGDAIDDARDLIRPAVLAELAPALNATTYHAQEKPMHSTDAAGFAFTASAPMTDCPRSARDSYA